jgi:hypothetical protein
MPVKHTVAQPDVTTAFSVFALLTRDVVGCAGKQGSELCSETGQGHGKRSKRSAGEPTCSRAPQHNGGNHGNTICSLF